MQSNMGTPAQAEMLATTFDYHVGSAQIQCRGRNQASEYNIRDNYSQDKIKMQERQQLPEIDWLAHRDCFYIYVYKNIFKKIY